MHFWALGPPRPICSQALMSNLCWIGPNQTSGEASKRFHWDRIRRGRERDNPLATLPPAKWNTLYRSQEHNICILYSVQRARSTCPKYQFASNCEEELNQNTTSFLFIFLLHSAFLSRSRGKESGKDVKERERGKCWNLQWCEISRQSRPALAKGRYVNLKRILEHLDWNAPALSVSVFREISVD